MVHQMALIDAFVENLEDSLHIKHQKLSFEEVWAADPPHEADGATLTEYMKDASRDSFFYADYQNFASFRHEYRAEFGKDAYLSPPVKWQWNLASTITATAHEEAMCRLEVYAMWFTSAILRPSMQNTLIILPIEEIAPRYRDELPASRFNPVGVPNLFLAPILKAPELTIPIGEFEYESRVSGNVEKLPVGVSIMGAFGESIFFFSGFIEGM
ncbi:hypothetical protein NX059_002166 [Plenodomus lindquistii]|nr:hypothetical protein NX059_002166 [Plenodomus lindquistii]